MADSSINAREISRKSSVTRHLKRRDSSTMTIYKVPARLGRDKYDDYEPQIISFGPYHHGKPKFQAMEKYKWSFLEEILSFRPEIPCEHYIEAIKEEAKIRTCYTDDFDIDSEEFVEMMLIDGCFLVGYLLQCYYGVPGQLELNSFAGMHDLIRREILLLENQLPFFILIKIFELLEHTPPSCPSSFMDLAIGCFNHWLVKGEVTLHPRRLHTQGSLASTDPIHQTPSSNVRPEEETLLISIPVQESVHHPPSPPPSATPHHLLHLYHSWCLETPQAGDEPDPKHPPPLPSATHHHLLHLYHSWCLDTPQAGDEPDPKHPPPLPSASVLHEAGVKFEKKEVNESGTLDVTFDNGKMRIPPLVLDTYTKSKLRNLVAFEQFYPNFDKLDKSFTAYVQFMDFIVNTPADVALLYEEGIICHFLGSDNNAANFFNDLNPGVFVKRGHYLAGLYTNVYKYAKKRRHRWRAMLINNYCNSPWAVLGIVVGGILLVLALLQTFFSG